ncbi:lytic transglycosylase domain-containing protein [Phenylobacterium sp.]|jgi:type IV secretion system protein VirB1|uniref:lytic transglycosylase domain-containing protein n=1 Tax=Phenylobacterium sp. TaxID=1871053 RepID=UPI002E32E27C|nr:lytic transglycosylase domain-containing protein [Phenylobacterium sp.]HEX3364998.1 lytic transglycosylase domain-containing protein [Phenylobacterium sp.]
MRLDPTTVLSLAAACAPQVSPDTLLAVVQVESGDDPLVIGINGPGGQRVSPTTPEVAVRTAEALRGAGRNFDVGLAQINVRNLARLGLSLKDAFDPCRNLAASAKVLVADWRLSVSTTGSAAAALGATLSRYNTGGARRGFANGYVARVTAAAGPPAPQFARAASSSRSTTIAVSSRAPWDVFGGGRASPHQAFVFNPNTGVEQ